MASTDQLNTTTSSGTQSAVSSPQNSDTTSSASISGGTPATIQPGTTASLLTSSGGIPLGTANLSTVNVAATTTQSTASSAAIHHKFNPALLSISGVLLVVAIALFWATGRTAKNTTKR